MGYSGLRSLRSISGCLLAATSVLGQEPEELLSTPLAEAFGAAPYVRGLRLSPDGSRISFIREHPDGYSIVGVFDTRSGDTTVAMAARPDGYAIDWCGWANDERIICSLHYVALRRRGIKSPRTRLAAVNADGSEPVVLLDERPAVTVQDQDRIVDWLPDDPEHVLLGLQSRFVRRNIHNRETELVDRADGVVDWIADEQGTARLRATLSLANRIWYLREPDEGAWFRFHVTALTDLEDSFRPVAFDGDLNEVLFFDSHDGRRALFAMELENRRRRLVYAHPRVDVADVHRMGRHNRIVGAVTVEHRPMQHLFEPANRRVHDLLVAEFPGMTIHVIDEDWAKRRYLVLVNSDRDPGTYYVFDSEGPALTAFARAFPALSERELAPTRRLGYAAADGTEIPADLTVPPDGATRAGIVLPHGGPSTLDYSKLDFLAQFLAAQGYAVLQTRYRGSTGYGQAWSGEGVFKGWRQAVDDVADGARHLVEAGLSDPGRVCVVGWGDGGYVALLSAIEHLRLYRCVVGIAGVTDPTLLARRTVYFVGGRRDQTFIGSGSEVRDDGSPLRRADEIVVPTLLFHAHDDVAVPLEHALALRDAMLDAGADVELIEYEDAEHDIAPPRYRVDMLARLGAFLETHLGTPMPDFYSRSSQGEDKIEIVDFGVDASQPNGLCSDTRFTGADGGVLRDFEDRFRVARDDATDCRRLFLSGDIVLRDTLAQNYADDVPPPDQVTIFIDPMQQTGVGIGSIERTSIDSDEGLSAVYVRPGYRIVGVRATELQYRCTVRLHAAAAATAEEPVYSAEPAGRDAGASQVRIPAYAGRYYRIRASVVDETLMLQVTDAYDDRVVVDQRELDFAGCN